MISFPRIKQMEDSEDWDNCHPTPYSVYVLKCERSRSFTGEWQKNIWFKRSVLSFGLIWNSYGRSFDIPIGLWRLS